jgi:hypothetical protein
MKSPSLALAALRFFLFPLLIVLGSFNPLAASGTGTISGKVTSAGTSPPYPLAGVRLTLVRHGSQMTTVTDAQGNYSFTGLDAAEYGLKLKVRHILHLDCDRDIDLLQGDTVTVNISVIPRLTLTPLCSANPMVSRHWSVHNPLPVPVNFTWALVHPSNKTGSGVASPGDSTFDTPAVRGDQDDDDEHARDDADNNRVRILVSRVVVDDKVNHGEICSGHCRRWCRSRWNRSSN